MTCASVYKSKLRINLKKLKVRINKVEEDINSLLESLDYDNRLSINKNKERNSQNGNKTQ